MSVTISAFNHDDWQYRRLADFADFADQLCERDVGEDAFGGYGEWFFVPVDPLPNGDRVIYFGSWGNDYSPGASAYTNAEVFDGNDPVELAEFTLRVQEWEAKPEADEQP
jgi:hypothetical protein